MTVLKQNHACQFHPCIRMSLQWRHNKYYVVSNHRRIDALLNRLFRRRSKKTSKLLVTGLCAGDSPVTGEFPSQRPVTRKIFDDEWLEQFLICADRSDACCQRRQPSEVTMPPQLRLWRHIIQYTHHITSINIPSMDWQVRNPFFILNGMLFPQNQQVNAHYLLLYHL